MVWCKEVPVLEKTKQDLSLLQPELSLAAVGAMRTGDCFGEGRLPGCSRRGGDVNSTVTFEFQCVPPRDFLLAGLIVEQSRKGKKRLPFWGFFLRRDENSK